MDTQSTASTCEVAGPVLIGLGQLPRSQCASRAGSLLLILPIDMQATEDTDMTLKQRYHVTRADGLSFQRLQQLSLNISFQWLYFNEAYMKRIIQLSWVFIRFKEILVNKMLSVLMKL